MIPIYEQNILHFNAYEHHSYLTYPIRFHRNIEICLNLGNDALVFVDKKEYTLSYGDLYISFPNTPHGLLPQNEEMKKSSQKSGYKRYFLLFDCELCPSFSDIFNNYTPVIPILRKSDNFERIKNSIKNLIHIQNKDQIKYYDKIISANIESIMAEILSSIELKKLNPDNDIVLKIINIIADNYRSGISLEYIAKNLGYSKFYISRIINNTFGCNFRNLINYYRISLSENLLTYTDKSINQIARESGFINQSTFDRVFQSLNEISPKEYRNKNLNQSEK